ncbi:MAG: hypothetical protein WBC83_01940 [Minisyncoccia bacterium]
MKLVELQINAAGEKGWGSPLLKFGDDITQLYGPNGCGKTPVIHSIAFALGYPVKFRDDIKGQCGSVTLKASHNNQIITFVREFSPTLDVRCEVEGQDEPKHFYGEKELSDFIFDFIGIEVNALTSVQQKPTSAYISTFFPLFYVDQDTGFTQAYKSPFNFIKDQYPEMVRLALGIPPKHAFELKKLLFQRKKELDQVNSQIVGRTQFLESLLDSHEGDLRSLQDVTRNIDALTTELSALRGSKDASSDVDIALQSMVNEKSMERRKVSLRLRDQEDRVFSFRKIQNEIELEIETLSLNEEARRMFSSFQDICANEHCRIFTNSSESYGKNLLYLRDQIKDLEATVVGLEAKCEELQAQLNALDGEINALKTQLQNESGIETVDKLVNTISSLTRALIDSQKEKETIERIHSVKNEHIELLNLREKLNHDIASMSFTGGSSDIRIIEFKREYKRKLIEWLDVLSTKNVDREISIDNDFGITFGTEKITQFSGSTLLRVVLAMRAAFFDLYLSNGQKAIEFLIFDTPKQQDIETEHFGAFVTKLKKLVADKDCQVVFSTTEYHYEIKEHDAEWTPVFPGKEQTMFLGPV